MNAKELLQQLEGQQQRLAELQAEKATLESEAESLEQKKRTLAGRALIDQHEDAQTELDTCDRRLGEISRLV